MCLPTAVKQLVLTVKLSKQKRACLLTNTPRNTSVSCFKYQTHYLYLTQKRNPHLFVAITRNATRERHNNRITCRASDSTALHWPVSRETMYHIERNKCYKHSKQCIIASAGNSIHSRQRNVVAYLCASTASHCRREVRIAKKLNATQQENNNPNLQGVDGIFLTLH